MKEGPDKSVSAWEKAKILSVIEEKETDILAKCCVRSGEQIKLQDSCMGFSVSKSWAKWESKFI
ncbi:MAG TPA: hypothetical protein VFH87_00500 [Candidatus Udaeobacter sp.]|nr:hypothetical protein [Candidatus Udaeobacter sp.]